MLYSLRAIHNSSLQMNKYLTSPCCLPTQHRFRHRRRRCRRLYSYICARNKQQQYQFQRHRQQRNQYGQKSKERYENFGFLWNCIRMVFQNGSVYVTYRHFQSNEIFYLSLMFIPSLPHQFGWMHVCMCCRVCVPYATVQFNTIYHRHNTEFNSVEFMQLKWRGVQRSSSP